MQDIWTLRHLVSGQAGLSMGLQVEWTKSTLWDIGRKVELLVDSAMKSSWGNVVGQQKWWDVVASLADHKQGGQQLQRMYQTMKARGYQNPPTAIGQQAGMEFTAGE
jgi:hypothetical protein